MFNFVNGLTLNNNIQHEFDYVIQAIHYTLVVTKRKKIAQSKSVMQYEKKSKVTIMIW